MGPTAPRVRVRTERFRSATGVLLVVKDNPDFAQFGHALLVEPADKVASSSLRVGLVVRPSEMASHTDTAFAGKSNLRGRLPEAVMGMCGGEP